MQKKSRKALHRGLKSLLSDDINEREHNNDSYSNFTNLIEVDNISANPFQPRKEFNNEDLNDLKRSIKEHGVLEPVILRLSKGKYELISGERRLRAVKELGIKSIPGIVKEKVSDRQMRILALVENLQRSNLNDIEVAEGYSELIKSFNYSHDDIAMQTGKSRSFVTNTLRLLKLPKDMREAVLEKKITSGHARAILSLDDSEQRQNLFKNIVDKKLNVRQAEQLSIKLKEGNSKKDIKGDNKKDSDLIELESKFSYYLKTKVKVNNKSKGGSIVIKYANINDLNRLLDIFERANEEQ